MRKIVKTGIAMLVASVMLVPSTGSAEPASPWACTGTAPAATSCTRVQTDAIVGAAFVFVEPAFGQFIGRIRLRLIQDSVTKLEFYCDYSGDAVKDVPGDATGSICDDPASYFPGEGEGWTLRCDTYTAGGFSGTGKGPWTCGIIAA